MTIRKTVIKRRRRSACAAGGVLLLLSLVASAAEDLKQQAIVEVERLAPSIGKNASRLWTLAELPLQEYQSSELLAAQLAKEGFKVERGVAELPTAFVATYGSGKPVIGVLVEYDAIPGLSNASRPEQAPRADGVTSGHGCGHNLLGAASTGAAVTLKRLMAKNGLKGTIKVFGSPAEERNIGKLYMAKAGVFNGLDAAIHWHPAEVTITANLDSRAEASVQMEFFGQGDAPGKGRSARAALEMTTYGINLLREFLPPTTAIHYSIAEAGKALDATPAYARLDLIVNDADETRVQEAYQRIARVAEGAARALDVEHKTSVPSVLHALLLNGPLNLAMQANLDRLVGITYDDADQAFGRALQKAAGLKESGFDGKALPLPETPFGGGIVTDVSEVSWNTPTVGFAAAVLPSELSLHTWAAVASAGAPSARKAAVFAAKAIALMGVDLLTDAALLERAQAAFQEGTGGKPYVAGIPVDQKPPVAIHEQR